MTSLFQDALAKYSRASRKYDENVSLMLHAACHDDAVKAKKRAYYYAKCQKTYMRQLQSLVETLKKK